MYAKPKLRSFFAGELQELIGPVQAASVELQIYTQQILTSQTKLPRVEQVVMVNENEKEGIVKYRHINV